MAAWYVRNIKISVSIKSVTSIPFQKICGYDGNSWIQCWTEWVCREQREPWGGEPLMENYSYTVQCLFSDNKQIWSNLTNLGGSFSAIDSAFCTYNYELLDTASQRHLRTYIFPTQHVFSFFAECQFKFPYVWTFLFFSHMMLIFWEISELDWTARYYYVFNLRS